MLYAVKVLVSALTIVLVSEISKKLPGLGALIASLPLVSVLGMIWLWFETRNTELLASHSTATFWFVLPSLPMFLVLPVLLHRGMNFFGALLAVCALTMVLYVLTVRLVGLN